MTVTARRTASAPPRRSPARHSEVVRPVSEPMPVRVSLPPLYPYLQQVSDPRDPRGCRHPLAALLALICLALLSGIHGYLPAHDWAAALPEADRFALGFTRPKAPAASTLFEVLRLVSWEALETQLRLWRAAAEQTCARAEAVAAPAARSGRRRPAAAPPDPHAVAIDGKALRGSWKRGAEIAGLLAVVTHRLALTVAQVPLAAKEGELTAVRGLFPQLVLTGLVVTVDAGFTYPDLAAQICAGGGEYVMRVKGNQPTLLANTRALLSPEYWERHLRAYTTTQEVGHGRQETRQLVAHQLTEEQKATLAWPHAEQVFAVISYRTQQGTPVGKPTIIHGVTSLAATEAGPERLLRLYRGHWAVENRAFWERDVVFGEDASPATTPNIVAVLACLRGAILNLIRFTQGDAGVAKTVRRFNADRSAALQALGCA